MRREDRRFWLIISILSIVMLLTAIEGSAQNFIEVQSYLDEGGVHPLLTGYTTNSADESPWSFRTFYRVTPTWGEALVGTAVHFNVSDLYVEFGAGVGIETAKPAGRSAQSMFLSLGGLSLLTFYEYGGSGSWYLVETNTPLLGGFGAGFYAQRFNGIGPRLQFATEQGKVYVAYILDPESEWREGVVLALRVHY